MNTRLLAVLLILASCHREPLVRAWPLLELPSGDSVDTPYWTLEDGGASVLLMNRYAPGAIRESLAGKSYIEGLEATYPSRASCSATECTVVGTSLRFRIDGDIQGRPSAWPVGRTGLLAAKRGPDRKVSFFMWTAPGAQPWRYLGEDPWDEYSIASDPQGSTIIVLAARRSTGPGAVQLTAFALAAEGGAPLWKRDISFRTDTIRDYPIFVSSNGARAIFARAEYLDSDEHLAHIITILDARTGQTVGQLNEFTAWHSADFGHSTVVDVVGDYLWSFVVGHSPGFLHRSDPSFGCRMDVYRLSDGKHLLGEAPDDYERVFGKDLDDNCPIRAVRPHPNGLMTSVEIVRGHIRLVLRRAIPPF